MDCDGWGVGTAMSSSQSCPSPLLELPQWPPSGSHPPSLCKGYLSYVKSFHLSAGNQEPPPTYKLERGVVRWGCQKHSGPKEGLAVGMVSIGWGCRDMGTLVLDPKRASHPQIILP